MKTAENHEKDFTSDDNHKKMIIIWNRKSLSSHHHLHFSFKWKSEHFEKKRKSISTSIWADFPLDFINAMQENNNSHPKMIDLIEISSLYSLLHRDLELESMDIRLNAMKLNLKKINLRDLRVQHCLFNWTYLVFGVEKKKKFLQFSVCLHGARLSFFIFLSISMLSDDRHDDDDGKLYNNEL